MMVGDSHRAKPAADRLGDEGVGPGVPFSFAYLRVAGQSRRSYPSTVPRRVDWKSSLTQTAPGWCPRGAGIGELRSLTGRRRLTDPYPGHSLELSYAEKRNVAPRSWRSRFKVPLTLPYDRCSPPVGTRRSIHISFSGSPRPAT